MQTINDGTHDILSAAAPDINRPDRARVPVTMLRQSDGKMRCDGSGAAEMQPEHPVAKRGRVQGASELEDWRKQRDTCKKSVYLRNLKEKRRWMQSLAKHDRLRGQDKGNRHRAAAVSGQALVCTLFWGGAGGTLVLDAARRVMAQRLGFTGFRPAPWPETGRFSAFPAGGVSLSADDEFRFRPKPGRIRSDTPKAGKTRSFFTQVKMITRQHQAASRRGHRRHRCPAPDRRRPRRAARPRAPPRGRA